MTIRLLSLVNFVNARVILFELGQRGTIWIVNKVESIASRCLVVQNLISLDILEN